MVENHNGWITTTDVSAIEKTFFKIESNWHQIESMSMNCITSTLEISRKFDESINKILENLKNE